jgi:acyl carrier protein
MKDGAMPESTETSEPQGVTDVELKEKILDIIAREGMIGRDTIKPESTLDDLGVQSIDVVIILNAIEDELKIYVPIDQTLSDIRTADDLVNAIIKLSNTDAQSASPAAAAN